MTEPTWTVTAWRCECHQHVFRRYPYTNRRWYMSEPGPGAEPTTEFKDLDTIRRYHPTLIPVEVSDVEAMLADVYEATRRALPVLLRTWDGFTAMWLATLPFQIATGIARTAVEIKDEKTEKRTHR